MTKGERSAESGSRRLAGRVANIVTQVHFSSIVDLEVWALGYIRNALSARPRSNAITHCRTGGLVLFPKCGSPRLIKCADAFLLPNAKLRLID